MFYSFKLLFYNIIKFKKDITEKACLVVLHGLAAADAIKYAENMQQICKICSRITNIHYAYSTYVAYITIKLRQILYIGPSECGRDRPGFGWFAVSQKTANHPIL